MKIVEGAESTFRLHPALNPENYFITNSIRSHERWRAMTYYGDYIDASKNINTGTMAPIGYIMISKIDDTIIPISRGDEHHRGYDTLYGLVSEKKMPINPKDYIAIWSYGNNYLYDKKEIPALLNVLTKFLNYGGPNGVLQGACSMSRISMTLRQFVNSGGNVELSPGKLAPLGEHFVELYKNVASLLTTARTNPFSRSPKLFEAAYELADFLAKCSWFITGDVSYAEIKSLPLEIKEFQKENNIAGLENLLFGFTGIKNKIHIELKRTVRRLQSNEERKYDDQGEEAKTMWGDLDLAIDILSRF